MEQPLEQGGLLRLAKASFLLGMGQHFALLRLGDVVEGDWIVHGDLLWSIDICLYSHLLMNGLQKNQPRLPFRNAVNWPLIHSSSASSSRL